MVRLSWLPSLLLAAGLLAACGAPATPTATVNQFWSDFLHGHTTAAAQLTTAPGTVGPTLEKVYRALSGIKALDGRSPANLTPHTTCRASQTALTSCTTTFPGTASSTTTTFTVQNVNGRWLIPASNFAGDS